MAPCGLSPLIRDGQAVLRHDIATDRERIARPIRRSVLATLSLMTLDVIEKVTGS